MKKKTTLINIVSSLVMQIVSVVSALIVPRIILTSFGSNANGLVSSISQFLSYIALVEGGITGVISANLYKPLLEHDEKKISQIISTANSFYRKIGFIFILYSVIIGIVYPVVVNTGYDNSYVFLLTMVLSIGSILQYMFSLTYTTLLNADKKVYLDAWLSTVLTVFNIGLVIITVKLFPDIIAVKFTNACLFALKPLVLGYYIKKKYRIDWNEERDNSLIKQRWNGFAINIAFFIHVSTDITLLTLFSSLSTVSVYGVYSMIVTKISVIIHSIASGIEPTIGQAYAKNDFDELNKKMDLYEFIVFMSVGIIFTVAGMLIAPFVMIYTHSVTDADYYQPLFGVLIVLAEAIYLLRYPHVTLAYCANKFKEITLPAYVESLINIVISIVLIKLMGLPGVAIGTLAGMIYRGIFHVRFTSRIIPNRKQSQFYKKLLIFTIASSISVLLCIILYPINNFAILEWFTHAIIYTIVCVTIYIIVAIVFFRKEIRFFSLYFKKR